MNEVNKSQVRELRWKIIAFYSGLIFLMVVSIIGGAFIAPSEVSQPCYAGAESVSEYNLACATENIYETILRLVMWVLLVVMGRNLLMSLLGIKNGQELNKNFHSPDNNDSPVIVLVGGAIMSALVISHVPLTDLATFLTNVTFRFSLGMIFFFFFEVTLLRLMGLRSLLMFVGLLQEEGTNSVAWVTFAALIMAGLFVTAPVF